MSVRLEGGCACGEVRYRLTSEPLFIHCCHCLNCQRQTGSAFVINLLIEADRVELLAGDPQPVSVPRSSGKKQKIWRCPTCQVAVYSEYTSPRVRFVRGGTLDDPRAVTPDVHIFTRSKVDWVTLPDGVPAFNVYYETKKLWPAASLERFEALAVLGNLVGVVAGVVAGLAGGRIPRHNRPQLVQVLVGQMADLPVQLHDVPQLHATRMLDGSSLRLRRRQVEQRLRGRDDRRGVAAVEGLPLRAHRPLTVRQLGRLRLLAPALATNLAASLPATLPELAEPRFALRFGFASMPLHLNSSRAAQHSPRPGRPIHGRKRSPMEQPSFAAGEHV